MVTLTAASAAGLPTNGLERRDLVLKGSSVIPVLVLTR